MQNLKGNCAPKKSEISTFVLNKTNYHIGFKLYKILGFKENTEFVQVKYYH